ncbi:MAG: adenosylcobinamide-GDP ribazoletransferase, partial [Proteobacteria bacterium]|nr:adenosylcobinamide-GDP ribazoletransferase [Pseudomonadota bacterium]
DRCVSFFWPPGTVAVLDVVFLVVITGAFHLDGLGDAADGLFSHRSKEQALEIMKDSRTGMMGLVAVFCILAIKIAGIYAIKTNGQISTTQWQYLFHTGLILLLVPAYARAATLFGIRFLEYGRKNTGTGLDLFKKPIGFKDFFFVVIIVAISLVLGYKGLVLNGVFMITTVLIVWFYKRKLNCITGDMLGAMTEVTEAVLFLTAGAAFI